MGIEAVVGDRTIDVHTRKLREKINDQNIKTVKGVGYKFNINADFISKNIALFSFALTALVIILLFFKNTTNQILWLESTALLLVVFFGSYFLVYKSVKRYIYDR